MLTNGNYVASSITSRREATKKKEPLSQRASLKSYLDGMWRVNALDQDDILYAYKTAWKQ